MKQVNIFFAIFFLTMVKVDVSFCINHKFKNDYIFCISIPKAGTHLLMKCLTLLQLPEVYFAYEHNGDHFKEKKRIIETKELIQKISIDEAAKVALDYLKYSIINEIDVAKRSYNAHLVFNNKSNRFINSHSKKSFLMIRDPRDQIVSFAQYLYKILPKNLDINFNLILMDLIKGQQTCNMPKDIPFKHLYSLCTTIGLVNFYNCFIDWSKNNKILIVKFENLVGPNGGGAQELQIKEIKKIGKHLELSLKKSDINYIIDNLYGGTWTFREGKLGNWRNYFTNEHVEAFKNMPGANQLLIDLGYETDLNW